MLYGGGLLFSKFSFEEMVREELKRDSRSSNGCTPIKAENLCIFLSDFCDPDELETFYVRGARGRIYVSVIGVGDVGSLVYEMDEEEFIEGYVEEFYYNWVYEKAG